MYARCIRHLEKNENHFVQRGKERKKFRFRHCHRVGTTTSNDDGTINRPYSLLRVLIVIVRWRREDKELEGALKN